MTTQQVTGWDWLTFVTLVVYAVHVAMQWLCDCFVDQEVVYTKIAGSWPALNESLLIHSG